MVCAEHVKHVGYRQAKKSIENTPFIELRSRKNGVDSIESSIVKRTKNGFNREVGTLVGNTTGNISRIGNNTIKTIVSTTRSTIVTIEKPTLRN